MHAAPAGLVFLHTCLQHQRCVPGRLPSRATGRAMLLAWCTCLALPTSLLPFANGNHQADLLLL